MLTYLGGPYPSSNHHHHLFAFMCITDFKKAYSRLLGEETSGNHQAYINPADLWLP